MYEHHAVMETFLKWESASRDTIDVKRCYIDVAGGLVPGFLLSQIIYWHLPNNGKPKLRVERDGRMWLAKKRADWFDECRVTTKQYDRAIRLLRQKGLVTTKLFKFAGNPIIHISVNFEVLVKRLDSILPKGEITIDPNGKTELPPLAKTSTESTTENIHKDMFTKTHNSSNIDEKNTQPLHQESEQSVQAVFNVWRDTGVIKNEKLTDGLKKTIGDALKHYTPEEISQAIKNYAEIVCKAEYYLDYRRTLQSFLNLRHDDHIAQFLDLKVAQVNFLKKDNDLKKKARPDDGKWHTSL